MRSYFPLLLLFAMGFLISFPTFTQSGSVTKNGKTIDLSKIHGKIQIVDQFPDFKVQIVNSFADLHVKRVQSFPDSEGKWQIVDHFPDYKIQIVKSFPDFKLKWVDSFPGVQ